MKKRTVSFIKWALIWGSFLVALPSQILGHAAEGETSLFDLMHYQEVLEVGLELDRLDVLQDRRNTNAYPAIFSFTDARGVTQNWQTKVTLRGKFRRTKCAAMPPLKLDFKKGDLRGAGLAEYDDFKLVTQCVEDEDLAKELLLKEYLAYRMYNQLSAESFRVQLLRITFKERSTGYEDQQWGFLIEDTAELRGRLGAEKWDNPIAIDSSDFDRQQVQKVAIFQSLIGNADWSIRTARNVKIFRKNGKAIVVPYDFDFSAMVAAPYRTLSQEVLENGVTAEHQAYLSNIRDLGDDSPIWQRIHQQEKAMIQLIKNCKELKTATRRYCIQLVQNFFDPTHGLQAMLVKSME